MGKRTVAFIMTDQDGLDVTNHCMLIETGLPDSGIVPAIMAASKDYLATDKGRSTWEGNNHCFNYGDFMLHVGNEFCEPHGFHVAGTYSTLSEGFNTQLADDVPLFVVAGHGSRLSVCREDVDDIMESAMTGCAYWTSRVDVLDGYLGEYASEQIARGGKLRFHLAEEEDGGIPDLDISRFQKGLSKWADMWCQPDRDISDGDGRIDPGKMDAGDADCIIQLALFDDIVYG